MKELYGTPVSTEELYQQNAEDTQQREEQFKPQKIYGEDINTSFKFQTPVEQPIGNVFLPYGGVKGIDERLTDVESLYDIPESRAQVQTGGELLGKAAAQFATEAVLGIPEAVGYMLDFEDIANYDQQAKEGFDNAFSRAFREAKEYVQDEYFPIYRTEKSQSDSLWDRMGDPTFWASQGKTLGTTVSLMAPSLAIGAATGGLGIGAIGTAFVSAGASRKAETFMEANNTFQSEYKRYLQEGKDDTEARKLAGKSASTVFKANAAMLPLDMLQFATLTKAFAPIKAITESTKLAKTASMGFQMGSEALEEGYQSVAQEEAIKQVREGINPFGKGFGDRLGEYIKDPDIQESALLGAFSGGVFEAGGKAINKGIEKVQGFAAAKSIAAQFNDKDSFDKIDNKIEADFLQKAARFDKFDQYIASANSYAKAVKNKEGITQEEIDEVNNKTNKLIENAAFVKKAKQDIKEINPEYKKNQNLATQYALNKYQDKKYSETIDDLTKTKSKLTTSDSKERAINLAIDIKADQLSKVKINSSKISKEDKQRLIGDLDAKINVNKEKLNNLVNTIKETEPSFNLNEYTTPNLNDYTKTAIQLSALESDRNLLRTQLAKAEKKSAEEINKEEKEIVEEKKVKVKQANKEAVKESIQKPLTPEQADEVSHGIGQVAEGEDAEALMGLFDSKAKSENIPTGATTKQEKYKEAPVSFVKHRDALANALEKESATKTPDVGVEYSDLSNVLKSAKNPQQLDNILSQLIPDSELELFVRHFDKKIDKEISKESNKKVKEQIKDLKKQLKSVDEGVEVNSIKNESTDSLQAKRDDIERRRQEELETTKNIGEDKLKEGRENTKKLVESLKQRYPATSVQGIIIRILEKLIDFSKYSIIIDSDYLNRRNASGQATWYGMIISQETFDGILAGKEFEVHTFIHEFIHGFTTSKISDYNIEKQGLIPNFKSKLTAKEKNAIEQLQRIFEKVKKDNPKSKEYGFTNLDEFIAETFSNTSFQYILKNTKAEGKKSNLFSEFIEAIGDLLFEQLERWAKRFNKEISERSTITGILEDVLAWTEDLIDQNNKLAYIATNEEINAKYDAELKAIDELEKQPSQVNTFKQNINFRSKQPDGTFSQEYTQMAQDLINNGLDEKALLNLLPNSKLTTYYDPSEVLAYAENKTNDEVGIGLKRVWLVDKNNNKVGILYAGKSDITYLKQQAINSPIQISVQNVWHETYNVGTEINSLENIFGTIGERTDIKLAFLGGSKEIPIIEPHESVSGRLNSTALLGDTGILLPGKNGENLFYTIDTRSLQDNRDDFEQVVQLLKDIPVHTTTDIPQQTRDIQDITPISIVKAKHNTTKPVYSFVVKNITDYQLGRLRAVKNTKGKPKITINEVFEEDKIVAYNVIVADDIIQNLNFTDHDNKKFYEQLRDEFATDDRLLNSAFIDWLGQLHYNVSKEDIIKFNETRDAETLSKISKRTRTKLNNNPLINPEFSYSIDNTEVKAPDNKDVVTKPSTTGTPVAQDASDFMQADPKDLVELNNLDLNNTEYIGSITNEGVVIEDDLTFDPDDVEDIEFDGKLSKGVKGEKYKVWNKEQELKWLKNNLPNFEPRDLEELKSILKDLNANVYGVFKDSMIYLSNTAKVGTAYHEAFHTVFWVGLTDSQRLNILKEAESKYKIFDPELLEELLAEDFAKYVQDENETGLTNKIKSLFKRLLNYIKNKVFSSTGIDYLYQQINDGKFSYIKPIPGLKITRLSSVFTAKEYNELVDIFTVTFQKVVDAYLNNPKNSALKNYSVKQLLTSQKPDKFDNYLDFFINKTRATLLAKFKDNTTASADWNRKMQTFLRESFTPIDNKIVAGPIGVKVIEKIGKVEGLKTSVDKVEEFDDIDYDIEFSEEENKLESWQYSTKEMSGEMGLSQEIRREISRIPSAESDFLGLYRKNLPFNEVYGYLKANLSDIPRKDLMMQKLASLVDYMPGLKGFVDKVNSDDLLGTKVFVDFAKTTVNFMHLYQHKNGSIMVRSSNDSMPENFIIDEWETNFYDNGWIDQEGNVTEVCLKLFSKEVPTGVGGKTKSIPRFTGLQGDVLLQEINDTFQLNLNPKSYNKINVKDLSLLFGKDLLDKKNIFVTNTNKLKPLAKTQAIYRIDLIESCFRNIENKNVYPHMIPGFAAKQISNIKNDIKAFEEKYKDDAFYKNSPLFNDLINNKEILGNLEYSLVDGAKFKGETDGTSYSDFSDRDYLAFIIAMFNNNGNSKYAWYQTPILADSPEGMFVKLPKYKDAEVLDKLVQVVKQEKARIESDVDLPDIKHYKSHKNKLLLIQMNIKPEQLATMTDANIRESVTNYLDDRFELYYKEIEKNNLLDTKDVVVDGKFSGLPFNEAPSAGEIANFRNILKNQYYNQVYAGSQIITLTTGDPAFYKNTTDFYKRSKEIVSPTLQADVTASYTLTDEENTGEKENVVRIGETYNTLYIKDHEIAGNIAKEFWQMYEGTKDAEYAKLAAQYGYSNHTITDEKGKEHKYVKVENVLYPSKPVNTADAQTFITPQRYRKVAVGFGRWNKTLQMTWNRVVNNETLLPEDYDVTFQAYKPFVFSHIKHESGKIIPTQNKNSEYMLTPQLIKGSKTLAGLYKLMQDKGIDSVSFTSVVKVGEYNAVSLVDAINGNITDENIHTLYNADYGLQQETPEHHVDSDALMGSQIRKLILSNIDFEATYIVAGKEITGKELYDEYHALISKNLEESYADTLEDFGDVVDGKFTLSWTKISNILQNEVLKRDLGQDMMNAVSLNKDGRLNIHSQDYTVAQNLEKLLNSVFKNRVTKQKIKGGSLIQASGVGFSDELNIKIAYNENGSPYIQEVECYLPWGSRKYFEPLMDSKGQIDITKVPDELLKMIGYRIPTEDKYSMLPLKVKGFLPFQAGGTIMLPIEITTLAGSDFDVDKLYIMMPEFGISKKYDFNKLAKELQERGYSVTAGYVGNLIKKSNSGTNLDARELEIYDDINLLPEEADIYLPKEIYKVKGVEKTEGRNNRLIDLMYGVLTNPSTFKAAITPGGVGAFQTPANLVYMAAHGKDFNQLKADLDSGTLTEDSLQKMVEDELNKSEKIGINDPYSNMKVFRRNMSGKALVGIMANHSVAHAMLQFTNIELTKPIYIDGVEYQSLHDTTDKNGNVISFGSWVAMATDNAKDPNAYKVNINTYTADVACLLNHLGVPSEEIFALLSQTTIIKLAENYFLEGATFQGEQKILEEVYKKYGQDVPDFSKINDTNISIEDLLKELKTPTAALQLQLLTKFMLYKNKATSLATLIRATKPDTKGIGPNMASNELMIMAIEEAKADKNLTGITELFEGKVYPMFNKFIEEGMIKSNELLKEVFPLSNTDVENPGRKVKDLIIKSISKNKLTEKDINKINGTILSYLGSKIPFYKLSDQKSFMEGFPAKFKLLTTNEMKKKYLILKYIKYVKNDEFEFARLEFKNTGAVTKILTDDLKASWREMFKDPNPEISKLAQNLVKYAYYKEGFIFGPKSFAHLIPSEFQTEFHTEIRQQWYSMLDSENVGLADSDVETIRDLFIENNWKIYSTRLDRKQLNEHFDAEFKGEVPVFITADRRAKQLVTGDNFVEYIRFAVPVITSTQFGTKTTMEYSLLKKTKSYFKGDIEVQATYTPVSKKGSGGKLLELSEGPSILKENNKYAQVVDQKQIVESNIKVAKSQPVEETLNTQEKEVNLQEMSEESTLSLSKTKQDIIDNLEFYSSKLEGITEEDIRNADAGKLGEILKKICK